MKRHRALAASDGDAVQMGREGTRAAVELEIVARVVAEAVPAVVEQLTTAGSRQLYRDALGTVERPLLAHALDLTGGNQIRAAYLLGINRNTLRKRCRELDIATPRRTGVTARRAS